MINILNWIILIEKMVSYYLLIIMPLKTVLAFFFITISLQFFWWQFHLVLFLHYFETDYYRRRWPLTLCGTRKLQFFYAEILPELKKRPMPKIVNAICKKIIKVKNSFAISGMYFSRWVFWVSVAAPKSQCSKSQCSKN